MEPIKVLIQLDDLYDTRFSMLCSKGVDRGLRAIAAGYHTRKDDSCLYDALGVDADGWDRLYHKRDNAILMRSVRTKMYNLLSEVVEEAAMTPRAYVNCSNVTITVNEYPYSLSPAARKEQGKIMQHYLGPVQIQWTNKPPKRMTPRWLVTNFTHCIMYNWNEWALHQIDIPDTERASLLNLTFVLPACLRNKPSEQELHEYHSMISGKPIHEMLEFAMGPGYTIRCQSVEYWNHPLNEGG